MKQRFAFLPVWLSGTIVRRGDDVRASDIRIGAMRGTWWWGRRYTMGWAPVRRNIRYEPGDIHFGPVDTTSYAECEPGFHAYTTASKAVEMTY